MTVLGGSNKISNTGTVSAGFGVGAVGIFAEGGQNLVANSGFISSGSTGIFVDGGNNTVSNTGTIVGLVAGLRILDNDNIISNHGTIESNGGAGSSEHGILFAFGSGNHFLNTGTVAVNGDIAIAVSVSTSALQVNTVINLGTITAESTAIGGGAGDETVVNRGTINGDVVLGGGNDVFDGRRGEVNGSVSGGAGDDTYIVTIPT